MKVRSRKVFVFVLRSLDIDAKSLSEDTIQRILLASLAAMFDA